MSPFAFWLFGTYKSRNNFRRFWALYRLRKALTVMLASMALLLAGPGFKTVHAQFYRRKAEWFGLMEKPHMVFWHVAEGHRPTLDEAMARLAHVEANGPTDFAFGWAEVMDAERLKALRCA